MRHRLFFFFKQKTAYEISTRDWSSDVCSSDLTRPARLAGHAERRQERALARPERLRWRGDETHGGVRRDLREGTARAHRGQIQPTLHRHLGAVQRRLGPVRYGAHFEFHEA